MARNPRNRNNGNSTGAAPTQGAAPVQEAAVAVVDDVEPIEATPETSDVKPAPPPWKIRAEKREEFLAQKYIVAPGSSLARKLPRRCGARHGNPVSARDIRRNTPTPIKRLLSRDIISEVEKPTEEKQLAE